jgi:hypothetical protein
VGGATVAERDRFFGGEGFDHFSDAFDMSHPIFNGSSVSDIDQEQSPTCQTLAALATWVKDMPDSRIKSLGNSRYDVTMVGRGKQTVSFNGTWSDNDPMPAEGAPEFWTILMQRARLQSYGVDYNDPKMADNWKSLDKKSGGKLSSAGQALYDFTGWRASWVAIGSAKPQAMADALSGGDYLVACSVGNDKKKGLSPDGIAYNHAYAVRAVYYDHGWKVRLYNPWHSDRGDGKTIDQSNPKDDGFITLPWSTFVRTTNFQGYYVA